MANAALLPTKDAAGLAMAAVSRAQCALRWAFVADSLAMPVHWFYNVSDIVSQFGRDGITRLEAAPKRHPSSIMTLHSTQSGGRKGAAGQPTQRQIVGEVILKGKQQFWSGDRTTHYHQGMRAGENTLNAHCARLLLRTWAASGRRYDQSKWLDAYIDFMTASNPQHPDTYAESYHRGFFANLLQGKDRAECGQVTHDTPSVGGIVAVAPLALAEFARQSPALSSSSSSAASALADTQRLCRRHLRLTHPDRTLERVCDAYVRLLDNLLFRRQPSSGAAAWPSVVRGHLETCARECWPDLDLAALALKHEGRPDTEVVGRRFSSACYITDSFPSLLYLAHKYCGRPQEGLLANTNLGGDNVHRGFVLAIVLALSVDSPDGEAERPPPFFDELADQLAIDNELAAAFAAQPE